MLDNVAAVVVGFVILDGVIVHLSANCDGCFDLSINLTAVDDNLLIASEVTCLMKPQPLLNFCLLDFDSLNWDRLPYKYSMTGLQT